MSRPSSHSCRTPLAHSLRGSHPPCLSTAASRLSGEWPPKASALAIGKAGKIDWTAPTLQARSTAARNTALGTAVTTLLPTIETAEPASSRDERKATPAKTDRDDNGTRLNDQPVHAAADDGHAEPGAGAGAGAGTGAGAGSGAHAGAAPGSGRIGSSRRGEGRVAPDLVVLTAAPLVVKHGNRVVPMPELDVEAEKAALRSGRCAVQAASVCLRR